MDNLNQTSMVLTVTDFQFFSLIISVIAIISITIIIFARKRALFFYISMLIAWIPGIVFYVGTLYYYDTFYNFFGIPAITVSAMLRTYQYFLFGLWYTFEAIDIIIEKIKYLIVSYRLKKAIKNLTERMGQEEDNGNS